MGILSDADLQQPGFVFSTSYNMGYNAGIALGYDFGYFRTEGEFFYKSNGTDEIQVGSATVPLEDSVSAMGFMANGYLETDLGRTGLTPFMGIGLGAANINADLSTSAQNISDDSSLEMAYQLIAGLGYEISSRLTLTADYRYFATTDPELDDITGKPLNFEYSSHNFNLGLRYLF